MRIMNNIQINNTEKMYMQDPLNYVKESYPDILISP